MLIYKYLNFNCKYTRSETLKEEMQNPIKRILTSGLKQ